jgi:hypothetical protein
VSDVVEEPAPVDPFKVTHTKKAIQGEGAEKITLLGNKPAQGEELNAVHEGPGVKKAHNYRWTTVENQFCRKKKRLFDDLQIA